MDWMFALIFLVGMVLMGVAVIGGFVFLAVKWNRRENPWTENPWKWWG